MAEANYNSNTRLNKFKVGDLVWIHNNREPKRTNVNVLYVIQI